MSNINKKQNPPQMLKKITFKVKASTVRKLKYLSADTEKDLSTLADIALREFITKHN